MSHGHRLPIAFLALGSFLAPWVSAHAQVFVFPRHADKSQVRFFDFEWKHIDIQVGPEAEPGLIDADIEEIAPPSIPEGGAPVTGAVVGSPTPDPSDAHPTQHREEDEGAGDVASRAPPRRVTTNGDGPATSSPWYEEKDDLLSPRSGGVRLYFYEREREIAEKAAALVRANYRQLVDDFDHVPTETFPYILYSSYQEFLQTNLFPLSEGTLGVTSPVDLKLSLPYLGDHQLFTEVSSHEMVHQFTIQKIRAVTRAAGVEGEPIQAMPLWFIEGIAEYYTHRGIDPEAEMLMRDLMVNADIERGYAMLDFFEDRVRNFLWTYKMGQVRAGFLEETYGEGTIQEILSEAPALAGVSGGQGQGDGVDFQKLVQRITGDSPAALSLRFDEWLKHRAFRRYLDATQSVTAVEPLEDLQEPLAALAASPEGNLLMYKTQDFNTGRSVLKLLDRRSPERVLTVVKDGIPGAESLHPIFGRTFAVGRDALVYVAESNGHDVIYWQKVESTATRLEDAAASVLRPGELELDERESWEVRLGLGRKVAFHLHKEGILAAFGPALSPDARRIAFVGLAIDGTRDVYLLEPTDPRGGYRLVQLTDDEYSERQIAWGKDGIVFNSDATQHGYYNLFKVSPERPGVIERLTTEARDHLDPTLLPDGRLFLTTFDDTSGDLHELMGRRLVRRTDVPTGLFNAQPAPDGELWALLHQTGVRRVVRVPSGQLLSLESRTQESPDGARELQQFALGDAESYRPFAWENLELGNPFALIGGGSGGIYGQAFASASDRLRNHAMLLSLQIYGSFEFTDGLLFYINQEGRMSWGVGLFQAIQVRFDRTFALPNLQTLVTGERYFGAMGSVRYPFNRFVYVEGQVSAGGVNYILTRPNQLILATPEFNGSGRDLLDDWRAANGGPRLQTEATARFGYDTLRWAPGTGPIAGSSVLLEATAALQPVQLEHFGHLRLDAAQYIPIAGRTHVLLRMGAGTTFGGRFSRPFFLSSFDTLRGVPYGRTDYLLGNHFLFSTAELQVPLNAILQFLFLSDVEAVAGLDFGGVSDTRRGVWDRRILNYALGVNFSVGPIQFRLHFARPIDVGAELPVAEGQWVTNFSIGVAGLPGFMKEAPSHGRRVDMGLVGMR